MACCRQFQNALPAKSLFYSMSHSSEQVLNERRVPVEIWTGSPGPGQTGRAETTAGAEGVYTPVHEHRGIVDGASVETTTDLDLLLITATNQLMINEMMIMMNE
jgi:hypothetical protein